MRALHLWLGFLWLVAGLSEMEDDLPGGSGWKTLLTVWSDEIC